MRQAVNRVRIEGILSEIDLGYHTYDKQGRVTDCVRGTVKIRVDQDVQGEKTILEIPISMFANKLKNDGNPNPAYDSISKVMGLTSIAAGGEELADRVRVTGAQIRMNEYYDQNGRLISFPRINASFVNKIRKDEMVPAASFELEFVIGKIEDEIKNVKGEEEVTGRQKIQAIVPQFGGRIDVVPLIIENPKVASVINANWSEGDTVSAAGRLNFTTETREEAVELDFGEAAPIQRTFSISELFLIGGAKAPLTGELEFDKADIQQGLAERKARLDKQKEKDMTRNSSKTNTPPPFDQAGTNDLGF